MFLVVGVGQARSSAENTGRAAWAKYTRRSRVKYESSFRWGRDDEALVPQYPQGAADSAERNLVLLGKGSLAGQSRARRQGAVADAGLDVIRQLGVSVLRSVLHLEITCRHTGNLGWSLPARIRRERLIVVHRVTAR